MAIPPAFEVRLAAYDITPDVLDARREIWAIVGPSLDAIVADYLNRSRNVAPALADHMARNRKAFFDVIKTYTTKLLNSPFDEAWVSDAEARAKFEIEMDL